MGYQQLLLCLVVFYNFFYLPQANINGETIEFSVCDHTLMLLAFHVQGTMVHETLVYWSDSEGYRRRACPCSSSSPNQLESARRSSYYC